MEINFEYVDVAASMRLESLAGKKVDALANKYDFIVATDIYFKKENTSSDTTGFHCVIRMNVPGTSLVAKANKDSFEHAIKTAVNDIERQLKKKKEKMQHPLQK